MAWTISNDSALKKMEQVAIDMLTDGIQDNQLDEYGVVIRYCVYSKSGELLLWERNENYELERAFAIIRSQPFFC